MSWVINLIFSTEKNGSGKTSFLEAIYYLGFGGSFRCSLVKNIISYDKDSFLLFSKGSFLEEGDHFSVGIQRFQSGDMQMRISKEKVKNRTQLVKLLPIQLINAQSYRLLESTPLYRRQFMNWGLFYKDEDLFLKVWSKVNKILKQRNSVLKRSWIKENSFWDDELVKISYELHQMRQIYIESLTPILYELIGQLLDLEISMEYYPGWNLNEDLKEVLSNSLERDLRLGYTGSGPHRADLKFKTTKGNVSNILSRGQQKLLIYALRLAQGLLMQRHTKKQSIYLIDDLPSELDLEKQEYMIELLKKIKSQVFITGIDRKELQNFFKKTSELRVFHVEHGNINEKILNLLE